MVLTPWEVLEQRPLLERRYLRVTEHRVLLPRDVVLDDFCVVESPPWAAMLCITSQQELILVRQYRHGHQGTSLELPAGSIDPGEQPLDAAIRELREETGYDCEEASDFWKTRPEPARHRQWAHFAIAKAGRKPADQKLEESENICVELCPLAHLDAALEQMVHAVHVAAILTAVRRGLL